MFCSFSGVAHYPCPRDRDYFLTYHGGGQMELPTADSNQDCLLIFEPGSVCSVADVKRCPEGFPSYLEVVTWIESYVVRPNAQLGREGPVCPRAQPSMDRNLIKFATIRTKEAAADEAVRKCEAVIGAFYALFPNRDDRTLATLLILFPDIERNKASEFIDGGHRRLRSTFVKNGLMLGEFHPQSTVPGTYNPAFRAMRAPMPLFAVRAISEHDHKFLLRPEFPLEERLECLEALLAFVGNKLDRTAKASVEFAMSKLKA
jgi:hypothetical protein